MSNLIRATAAFLLLLATPLVAAPIEQVRILSYELTDNGDADGFADSNETVEVRLVVANVSGYDLTGVVARLRSENPTLACATQPLITISSLAAGETRVTTGAFEFRLDDQQRTGSCSISGVTCTADAACTSGVDDVCHAPFVDFVARFQVLFSSDQLPDLSGPQPLVIDLDLDVSGGAGRTTFFESFEGGSFTAMNLDQGRNDFTGSDGYRCQYHDPDWTNSNSYGTTTDCFLGATAAQVDAYYWQTVGPESSDGGRAFTGVRSLYMGIFLPGELGYTTPLAGLEAAGVPGFVHVGWGKVCSETRSTVCESVLDCPVGESCVGVTPTLSLKQQISLLDYRSVNTQDGRAPDRGVVHAQQIDSAGSPVGDWIKLQPYLNVYDIQGEDNYYNCMFDPVDDGNTEDDVFDPTDPFSRLGPSSTCFPSYSFAYLGDTDEPFDVGRIGRASHGPGLHGSAGDGTWVESRFDLSRFRGRSLRLRFLNASLKAGTYETWEGIFTFNPDPGDDGWWIDDVTVTDVFVNPSTIRADVKDNSGFPALTDGDGDGSADACDNCPVDPNAGQADADGDLIGDLCDVCPLDPTDDVDADGLCCDVDNCCDVFNPDQEDADGDGAGDPCDVDPVVRVSLDPADQPDYTSIQAAVNFAVQSGTRIEILPGTYTEQVEIDSNMVFFIVGVDDGSGEPVIVDGTWAAGLEFSSTAGHVNSGVRNLTIRGSTGLRSLVPITVTDCVFEQNSVSAIDLHAPASVVRRVTIASPTSTRGIWIRSGGGALIEHVRIQNLDGRGIRVNAPTVIRNSLISDCQFGVDSYEGSPIVLEHSTVANNLHTGLLTDPDTVVSVRSSILHGNGADLISVDCASVEWSIVGDLDCSSVNNNLFGDPGLTADYHLLPTSIAIDHGPDPAAFDGVPCVDLDGSPRLRDYTGDGLAEVDAGAFENENTTLLPAEATGLAWTDKRTMTWNEDLSVAAYHLYRGTLANLDFDDYGVCRDDLLPFPTATNMTDPEIPLPGDGFFYEVSHDSGLDGESSLGVGRCAERSNYQPCP